MENGDRHTGALATTGSRTRRLQRRQFLALVVTGAAGPAWLPATAATPAVGIPERMLASPDLLGLLGSQRVVRDVGEGYRRLVPAENDLHALTRAIVGPAGTIVPGNVATWIAAQVRQDFAQGRTVTVRGWVLAVTEARQCALYSLHGA